ncbi:kinesin [Angomonas deanei]|uniref:Kinesin-like protein n=1 Tax=Angomonas deanei TaxID=59799 RepID=A0A7G2CC22_9TRYP|nr:kinesin [Angomonas deanei]CAD2215622.1 Microtubule binding/Kinesin motor domain containing protein, putative [Angomonas deanei]|eukprot:EPY33034.1 kinesin [Angomonas deanei]
MSIEVHVRLRPSDETPVWSSADTVLYSAINPNTRYIYNKVHPSNVNNKTVFQSMEAVLFAAVDGKNVTVLAYGQTGSGKTHSMTGSTEDQGIVPRAAKLLLDWVSRHNAQGGATQYALQGYYTEIYNEQVRDLLEPEKGEVQLHDAPDGGVRWERRVFTIDSYEDFLKLQNAAEKNRKYGVTNMNDHSSRSHIILTFELLRKTSSSENGVVKSVINLVDLAGSESAARAMTEGQTLREGGFINKSLLSLGNVVDAIVDKRPYIPYRDAKLTRILRNCLGGSGITFILCCVNPSRDNFEQTVSSLRFTQRAMRIKKDPVVLLSMPPLFAHQYGVAVRDALHPSCEARELALEHQRGLRDAYQYCNSTAGSVVAAHQAQVEDGITALQGMQRLLVANDQCLAVEQVGRQHNLLSQILEERQRQQQRRATAEKRLREEEDTLREVESKRRALEGAAEERVVADDTELAQWEYRLHEARKHVSSPLEVLYCEERAHRARVQYEWVVTIERIASRSIPFLIASLQAEALSEVNNENKDTPWGPVDFEHHRSVEERRQQLQEATALVHKTRTELQDLELACELVQEDIDYAREQQSGKSLSPAPRLEEISVAQRYYGVADEELEKSITRLEREERQLQQRARRETRKESLRAVRESLSQGSRSPLPTTGKSISPTPQHNNNKRQGYTSSKSNDHYNNNEGMNEYQHGVQNALSVLDSLKLRLQRGNRERLQNNNNNNNSNSNSVSQHQDPFLDESNNHMKQKNNNTRQVNYDEDEDVHTEVIRWSRSAGSTTC